VVRPGGVAVRHGAATLEVGCGEGRVARDLAALGHRVTAIDAAPSLIRAAQLAHPEGTYLVGDAAKLPFADRSFELVVAYNSLMDIAAMPTAVSEAARVLTPDGRLCLCVTHPLADIGEFVDRTAQAPFVITGSYLEDHVPPYAGRLVERDGLRLTFHSLRYSLEQYARALENAGLVIEAMREPPTPRAAAERDPSKQRWRRLPNFLMLRAANATSI
jgi:ubiquinone/menaquinone biosynthesis C-methylase UbiE